MRNDELFERAQQAIPGGVNSPVRAFGSVGGTPPFIASAKGATITDADGVERVDLVASWGPALLGHAHPQIVAAVQESAARGLSFGAPTEGEIALAEEITKRVPIAERVRLVSTGTEATMTAIRLARGATGRDLLVKFDGHYHGHSDALLAAAGSGLATLALPGSAGIPDAVAATTIVLPYDDEEAVTAAFAEHGEQIAAIIVEAAPANMGLIAPRTGFHEFLARTAHAHGALLISDEVLTGFRVGAGGMWGLSKPMGDDAPDILTFGKVVGGGMPLAALGGRADIMNLLAPLGPVYQAGTLSGNPLAVAAGLTQLQLADDAAYVKLNDVADAIIAGLHEALSAEGVEHVIPRVGTLFSLAFAAKEPRTFDEVKQQAAHRYPPFFHAMLDAGVALPPSVFEAWFVTTAHDNAAIERILAALPAAAKAAATA